VRTREVPRVGARLALGLPEGLGEFAPRRCALALELVARREIKSVPIPGSSLWLSANFGQASEKRFCSTSLRPS